jgi:hypothetical protein
MGHPVHIYSYGICHFNEKTGAKSYKICALKKHCVNHFIDDFQPIGVVALEQHFAKVSFKYACECAREHAPEGKSPKS